MIYIGSSKEYLELDSIDQHNSQVLKGSPESSLAILWFKSDNNELKVDGQNLTFHKDQMVFLTEFHRVEAIHIQKIRFLRFNRPFYCVLDNDAEVGCKGILFFGAAQLPVITVPEDQLEKLEILWKMFRIEMNSNDDLQMDMLQMMLKRYLILCKRLYKPLNPTIKNSDLIREFNFLVEKHFRVRHTLQEYAELLNKSSKTISNIFSKQGHKTPLQYINDRRMLEARRLLSYSNKQVQEIAYEIGFDNLQTFSRFFKRHEGVSPSDYKEKHFQVET